MCKLSWFQWVAYKAGWFVFRPISCLLAWSRWGSWVHPSTKRWLRCFGFVFGGLSGHLSMYTVSTYKHCTYSYGVWHWPHHCVMGFDLMLPSCEQMPAPLQNSLSSLHLWPHHEVNPNKLWMSLQLSLAFDIPSHFSFFKKKKKAFKKYICSVFTSLMQLGVLLVTEHYGRWTLSSSPPTKHTHTNYPLMFPVSWRPITLVLGKGSPSIRHMLMMTLLAFSQKPAFIWLTKTGG